MMEIFFSITSHTNRARLDAREASALKRGRERDGKYKSHEKSQNPNNLNPGENEIKFWDPHAGIIENIPGFPRILTNLKFSEKINEKIKNLKKNIKL